MSATRPLEVLAESSNATTITLTTAASTPANAVLLCVVGDGYYTAAAMPAPEGGGGTWSQVGQTADAGDNLPHVKVWQSLTTGGAQTISSASSQGDSDHHVTLYVYEPTTTVDATGIATGGAQGSQEIPGITAPNDSTLVGVWLCGPNGAPSYTPPASMTQDSQTPQAPYSTMLTASEEITAGATGPRTATIGSTSGITGWAGMLLAVNGPASTGPVVVSEEVTAPLALKSVGNLDDPVNLCLNPSAANNTDHYYTGYTLQRVAVSGFPRPNAIEIALGPGGSYNSYASVGNLPTLDMSVVIWTQVSRAQSVELAYDCYDPDNAYTGSAPATTVDLAANTPTPVSASVTFPPGTTRADLVAYFREAQDGDIAHLTCLRFQPGIAVIDYADGDSPGWVWDGTAGSSASHETASPVVVTEDVTAVLNFGTASTGSRVSADAVSTGLGLGGATASMASAAEETSAPITLATSTAGTATTSEAVAAPLELSASSSQGGVLADSVSAPLALDATTDERTATSDAVASPLTLEASGHGVTEAAAIDLSALTLGGTFTLDPQPSGSFTLDSFGGSLAMDTIGGSFNLDRLGGTMEVTG